MLMIMQIDIYIKQTTYTNKVGISNLGINIKILTGLKLGNKLASISLFI